MGHFSKNPWISPLTKSVDVRLNQISRLLSFSEHLIQTRSPVATAVVLMSHHDVISGFPLALFPLVIDLLCSSIAESGLVLLYINNRY